ncbi:MAG: rhodanese-like domain-containing protein [Egibacteraceae bacterium]
MFGKRASPPITPHQMGERRDGDFLDVREPDEWRAGHIDGGLPAWTRSGLALVSQDGGAGRVV